MVSRLCVILEVTKIHVRTEQITKVLPNVVFVVLGLWIPLCALTLRGKDVLRLCWSLHGFEHRVNEALSTILWATCCKFYTLLGDSISTESAFFPLLFSTATVVIQERTLCVFKHWWTRNKGKKNHPQECVNSEGFCAFPLIFFSPSNSCKSSWSLSLSTDSAEMNRNTHKYPTLEWKNAEIIPISIRPPFTLSPLRAAMPVPRRVSTCRGIIWHFFRFLLFACRT